MRTVSRELVRPRIILKPSPVNYYLHLTILPLSSSVLLTTALNEGWNSLFPLMNGNVIRDKLGWLRIREFLYGDARDIFECVCCLLKFDFPSEALEKSIGAACWVCFYLFKNAKLYTFTDFRLFFSLNSLFSDLLQKLWFLNTTSTQIVLFIC